MNKVLQLPLWIVCGYVFIVVGILTDGWVMRLVWLGLGMATLLANVLLTLRARNEAGGGRPHPDRADGSGAAGKPADREGP